MLQFRSASRAFKSHREHRDNFENFTDTKWDMRWARGPFQSSGSYMESWGSLSKNAVKRRTSNYCAVNGEVEKEVEKFWGVMQFQNLKRIRAKTIYSSYSIGIWVGVIFNQAWHKLNATIQRSLWTILAELFIEYFRQLCCRVEEYWFQKLIQYCRTSFQNLRVRIVN